MAKKEEINNISKLEALQETIKKIEKEYDVEKWSELKNVRYFYDFFKKHEKDFE